VTVQSHGDATRYLIGNGSPGSLNDLLSNAPSTRFAGKVALVPYQSGLKTVLAKKEDIVGFINTWNIPQNSTDFLFSAFGFSDDSGFYEKSSVGTMCTWYRIPLCNGKNTINSMLRIYHATEKG
jgi:hypothetical protein